MAAFLRHTLGYEKGIHHETRYCNLFDIFELGRRGRCVSGLQLNPATPMRARVNSCFKSGNFRFVAGGNNNIRNCRNVTPGTDRGRGYVTTAPDFTFSLSGMGAYQLVVSVVSECDSVLLVNTSSANWYYDDDDNGNLDAKIVLTRPSDGRLDVWVGTENGAVLRRDPVDGNVQTLSRQI